MRHLALLLAASSLALAGCGKKQATGNTTALDQGVTAQDFTANDATAIDAATGADANMAADVDINLIGNADNGSTPATAPRTKRAATDKSGGNDSAEATAPGEPATPAAETNSD